MASTYEEFVNSTIDFSSPTFDDCSKESHFGSSFYLSYYVITALCFFIGTPAHVWCLWLYIFPEQKTKKTQVFLLNHTVMEIIYCLECGTETLNIFTFNNETLWYVLYFFSGLAWIGRPLLQTCICIEQYMAVIHPVTFLRYKGIKYRIAAAVTAWFVALAYGLHSVISPTFPDYFYTSVFIITLTVISVCCVSVLCALKHPGPADTHSTQQTGRDVGNQQKRNAFNTIFSALLLILFTYFPQAMLIVFTRVDPLLLACTIVSLISSFNIFGVIITPFLTLYKVKKISKESKGNESCTISGNVRST